jgi:hypothetical protein
MCPILKKLSNNPQSYDEVVRTMKEILASKKGNDLRILEHFLSYAENQFGQKVAGIGYGEINWDTDVCILHQINRKKVEIFLMDDSMGGLTREEKMFPCFEGSISLFSPWLVYFDSNASDQSDNLRNTGINCLLEELSYVHHTMANITMNQSRLDVSEGHCQRCLTYSRRILFSTLYGFMAVCDYVKATSLVPCHIPRMGIIWSSMCMILFTLKCKKPLGS